MRQLLTLLLLLGLVGCATTSVTPDSATPEQDPRVVAESYLNAICGKGDETGYAALLGGATTNARLFALENWRMVTEAPTRHEEADLAAASKMMASLDEASRTAMATLMGSGSGDGSQSVEQLTPEVAAQLLGPTQASADLLVAGFPLLSEVLGVGKSVYFNPKNPARALAGGDRGGAYQLDLRAYEIETTEGPRKVPRRWKLKLVHFNASHLQTGWKVLPAADWNAE